MAQDLFFTRSEISSPAKAAELKKTLKALQTAYSKHVDLVEFLAPIGKAKTATYEDPVFRTVATRSPDLSLYLLHEPVEVWTRIVDRTTSPLEIAERFSAESRVGFSSRLKVNLSNQKPALFVWMRFAGGGNAFHFAISISFSQEDIPDYWPVKDHPDFWGVVARWCNDQLWPALGFGDQITTSVVEKPVFQLKHESSRAFRDNSCLKLQGKGDPYHEFALLVDTLARAKELFDAASTVGERDDSFSLKLSFTDKKTYASQRQKLNDFSSEWSCRVRATFEKTKDPFKRPARISAKDPPHWTVASSLYGGESFVNIVHEKEGSYLEFCSNQSREMIERLWAATGEDPEWWSEKPIGRWRS